VEIHFALLEKRKSGELASVNQILFSTADDSFIAWLSGCIVLDFLKITACLRLRGH
jgi:hypothetical protein